MESSGRVEKLDMVGEAELVVDGRDQVGHADDFLGQLVGAHEQVRVVLVEAAHAEQTVQGALEPWRWTRPISPARMGSSR